MQELLSAKTMPGVKCIVCGNDCTKGPNASFHLFQQCNIARKVARPGVLDMDELRLKPYSRVCSPTLVVV